MLLSMVTVIIHRVIKILMMARIWGMDLELLAHLPRPANTCWNGQTLPHIPSTWLSQHIIDLLNFFSKLIDVINNYACIQLAYYLKYVKSHEGMC